MKLFTLFSYFFFLQYLLFVYLFLMFLENGLGTLHILGNHSTTEYSQP